MARHDKPGDVNKPPPGMRFTGRTSTRGFPIFERVSSTTAPPTPTPTPAPTTTLTAGEINFQRARDRAATLERNFPSASLPVPPPTEDPTTKKQRIGSPTSTPTPQPGDINFRRPLPQPGDPRPTPPPIPFGPGGQGGDPGLVTLPPGTTFADLIKMDPEARDAVLAGTFIPRQQRDISQAPVAAPAPSVPTPTTTPKTTAPSVTEPPPVDVPKPVTGPYISAEPPPREVLNAGWSTLNDAIINPVITLTKGPDWDTNPANQVHVDWAEDILESARDSLSRGDFDAAVEALQRLDNDIVTEGLDPNLVSWLENTRTIARSVLKGFESAVPIRGFEAIASVTQPGGPDSPPVVDWEGLEGRAETFFNQQLEDLEAAFRAGKIDQATAQRLFDDISQRRDALSADIQTSIDNNLSPDSVWNRLLDDMGELREGITGTIDPETGEVLEPGLRSRTEEVVNDALDRLNQIISGSASFLLGLQTQALSDLASGRTAALTAAVDGIQGNIRSQQSEIDAALDLTDAQKLSMKGQIRMAGALALAPAVGAVLQQYDTLQAQVQQSFGSILGGFEGQALSETGALGRMGVSEIAASDKTAAELNSTILNLETGVGIARETARSTLVGIRTQVEAAGDSNLLSILPELGEPYIQYSPVMLNDYNMFKEIVGLEMAGIYERLGFDNVQKMVESMDEQNQSQFWLTWAGILGPIIFGRGFPLKA